MKAHSIRTRVSAFALGLGLLAFAGSAIAEQTGRITLGEAVDMAVAQTGRAQEELTVTRARLETEDGAWVYNVKLTAGKDKYEYDLRADDGSVVSLSEKADSAAQQGANPITREEAVSLALARVPGAAERDIRIKTDRENGRDVYEGDILYDGREYDFEIDVATGAFLEWEEEAADK